MVSTNDYERSSNDSPNNYEEVNYSKHYRGIRNGTSFGAQRKSKMILHQARYQSANPGATQASSTAPLSPNAITNQSGNIGSTFELIMNSTKDWRHIHKNISPMAQRADAIISDINMANQGESDYNQLQQNYNMMKSNSHGMNQSQAGYSVMSLTRDHNNRASIDEKVSKLE